MQACSEPRSSTICRSSGWCGTISPMRRSADCSAAISAAASLRPTSATPTPAHRTIPTSRRWRAPPASKASTSIARPTCPTRCARRSLRAGPISSTPISGPTRIRAAPACGSFPGWARASRPSAAATNPERPRTHAGTRCEATIAADHREGGMKRLVAACAAGMLAALIAHGASSQASFPTRAVRFIVPFPGGGINDILARIIGEKLQARWGQPIVIENKTGAGGNIGAELAYQSEPDGYTLLLAPPGPLAINQTLYKQLSYKPQDFVPITLVGSVPNVAIVRKELPVNSLKELIDYVKANPGKVTFGSQGNGATPHLTGMMFQGMTGTQMVHVPYRGETLVLQDMIGGHVDVFFGNVAAARPQFRDGKVKVVAVLDSKRAPTLPEIPTTAEAGLPGLVSTGWFALAAPPKASPALQAELAKTVADVINMPDVQARFRAASVEPTPSSAAEMAAFIKEESQRWGEIIKRNNIVVD